MAAPARANPPRRSDASSAVRGPALLTGFGLGAFLDGIVLHQVLQWHHLVVDYRDVDDLAGLEVNTLWDGLFHLFAWCVVVAGLGWLLRRRAALATTGVRPVVGDVLVGWGAFHVFDQVVFHLLLEAHHIRMVEDYQLYDWGYTAIGVGLIGIGTAVRRRAAGQVPQNVR